MKLEKLETSNYYHFYNRGNNKENIFIEEDNYMYFLSLVKKHLHPIIDLYSYCLLPNHFHFILRIKDEDFLPLKTKNNKMALSQPFSNLFNAYTKAFNKKYNRTGSLFQKHPKRIQIKDENYLLNLIIYVNTNPSHHNIADFTTYKYSSYQALIGNKKTAVKKNDVLKLFDDKENLKYMLQEKKINIELIQELLLE